MCRWNVYGGQASRNPLHTCARLCAVDRPHAPPRRSCRRWPDAESSFCNESNRAADPSFKPKPKYEYAAFQCQAVCSAEMQKSGPFFSRFWTRLEKVLIARSINLIRFLESHAVFFAKIEFPGSKGPADLFFHYFQQELAVCLCEKLRRRQIRKSFSSASMCTSNGIRKKNGEWGERAMRFPSHPL